jgi:phage terminase large subunit-like protein
MTISTDSSPIAEAKLPPATALELLTAEKNRRQSENRLAYYRPYPTQKKFHDAGAKYRERLLMAGNRVGKTFCGAMELAMHATGRYSDTWQGKRFDTAINAWCGGVTSQAARDVIQANLLGELGAQGTGAIPKDALLDIMPARGVPGLVDTIMVRHVSGGVSRIGLKSYAEGREKWQGTSQHVIWLDEEPDAFIYSEALTRIGTTDGITFMTFTPLLGMSEVVRRFLQQKSDDRHVTVMTLNEAEHISEEKRKQIVAGYPLHEVEARTKGTPILGSGRIFPIAEERLAIEHRTFPDHWPRIGAMDFGYEHHFAAVELVWDRDIDRVHVARCYRVNHSTPIEHAAALRSWGRDLRWAWPRDGKRETLEGAGIALAEQYKEQGLNMLHEHAQFEDGSVSVEAGLMKMYDMMKSGRFKVFKEHNDWWEEFRLYHRKDGKVVKEGDDLMCATRYGVMMLRYASTKSFSDKWRREIEYPKVNYV